MPGGKYLTEQREGMAGKSSNAHMNRWRDLRRPKDCGLMHKIPPMISLFPWLRRGLLLSVLSGCCLVPAVLYCYCLLSTSYVWYYVSCHKALVPVIGNNILQ